MFSQNNKISVRQLQILLILDVFGTGVIVMPRRAAEYAGQDAWIVTLIATGIALCYVWVMTTLGRRFSSHSFTHYAGMVLSRPVGIILSVLLAVKLIINNAMELRLFGEIVRHTLLATTPFWAVCAGMLTVTAYAAVKGIETRARIAELLIFLVFIPILLVFAFGAVNMDFSNLLPILTTSRGDLLLGGFSNTIAFTGLEFCMLMPMFLNKPQGLRKGAIFSVALTGLFMTLATVLTIAQFGPLDLANELWPVLEMMKAINLPGGFIERQDAIVMSFWIISVFTMVNAGLFFSATLLRDVVKRGKPPCYIAICAAAMFIISFIPENIPQVFDVMDIMFYTFGLAYMAAVPVILLVTAKLRGLGDDIA